jgi:hypothetical protein
MRNRSINLRSDLLRDYFNTESILLDLFIVNYNSVKRVLDNPEKFPDANYEYLVLIEEQMFLEAPIAISMRAV